MLLATLAATPTLPIFSLHLLLLFIPDQSSRRETQSRPSLSARRAKGRKGEWRRWRRWWYPLTDLAFSDPAIVTYEICPVSIFLFFSALLLLLPSAAAFSFCTHNKGSKVYPARHEKCSRRRKRVGIDLLTGTASPVSVLSLLHCCHCTVCCTLYSLRYVGKRRRRRRRPLAIACAHQHHKWEGTAKHATTTDHGWKSWIKGEGTRARPCGSRGEKRFIV